MKRTKQVERAKRSYEYDVCLSFAGENRTYVRTVAEALRTSGVRVFYDEYAQADMWGKDLYAHLDDIYQNAARFCALFVSKHYARNVWTNHERESAQARAIQQHAEYILPARFDSTKIPGMRPTIGHIDLRKVSPEQLATLIITKLGAQQKEDYFPPVPDNLFTHMKARSQKARNRLEARARHFFNALKRMSQEERRAVITLFLHACPAELPENVHMSFDLLRRVTEFTPAKLRRLLGSIGSLGFYTQLRKEERAEHDLAAGDQMVILEWHDMSTDDNISGNATGEANAVMNVGASGFCAEHALEALLLLNFSQLASATRTEDHHVQE